MRLPDVARVFRVQQRLLLFRVVARAHHDLGARQLRSPVGLLPRPLVRNQGRNRAFLSGAVRVEQLSLDGCPGLPDVLLLYIADDTSLLDTDGTVKIIALTRLGLATEAAAACGRLLDGHNLLRLVESPTAHKNMFLLGRIVFYLVFVFLFIQIVDAIEN